MGNLDSNTNAPRGKIGTKAVLILALVIVVGLGGVYLLLGPDRNSRSGARNLGDAFTAALAELQTENTFQMLSQSYQDNSTTEQWDIWVEFTFNGYQGAPPKLIDEIQIDPGGAYSDSEEPTILVYEFEFDGETHKLPLTLMLEEGEWRVNEIGGWRQ